MLNKTDYDNMLRQQCLSLPALCQPQIDGVLKGLQNTLTEAEMKGLHKVYITGCGDSYMAARAAVPAFRQFAGAFGFDVKAAPAIEVCRYIEFDPRYAASTLVIGISASGGPNRVVEAMRRANEKGCLSLAITNNAASKVAGEAKAALIVNTPAMENANPGLRNYYASLLGLYFFAARVGEVMGRSQPGTMDALAEAVRAFTQSHAPLLEALDDQMFALAQAWQNFKCYEFIGDDILRSTAEFGAAKIVETAGKLTAVDDAEDWCHVGYFLRQPQQIGTTVVADVTAGDKSRIAETVHQAAGIGRPVLLVANAGKDAFGITEDIEVCALPKAPEGYPFMLPLLNYLPSALLAGYLSTLTGEPFFRGGRSPWGDEGVGTIGTSQIDIV